MAEAGRRSRFSQETKPRGFIAEEFLTDDFQCHGAPQVDIERLVCDAHRTATQLDPFPVLILNNLIMRKPLRPRLERWLTKGLVAKHKGEVTAEVTLAQKPSEAHLAAIKDVLTAMTRKDVHMDVKIDPAIIGGLVVKLGSRMVDTSLRTKLNAIRLAMKEAR